MTCKHREAYPEGVVLPPDVSLEHFDTCMTADERLRRWGYVQDWAAQSARCFQADHEGAIEQLRACQVQLAGLMRDVAGVPRRQKMRTEYRSRARRRTRSHR